MLIFDVTRPDSLLSLHGMACMGLAFLASGELCLGPFLPTLDLVHLASSVSLQSFSHMEALPFVVDFTLVGLPLSLQSFARLGFAAPASDFLHLGFSPLVRDLVHLGSRMFLMGKCCPELILSLLDVAEFDPSLSLRSVLRLDSLLFASDFVGMESLIFLQQSCHSDLISSALGLTCLGFVSSSSVIDWTIPGLMSLLREFA